MQVGSLDTAALDVLVGTEGKSKKESRPITSRRQKSKPAWDPSWPAQPDHGGSDGEARSDTSESDSEDLIGEARLDRLAVELKDLPVSNLYPEIAAAGLEVCLLDPCFRPPESCLCCAGIQAMEATLHGSAFSMGAFY